MGSNGRTDSNATVVLKPLFNACLTGKLHGLYDWCRQSITNDFAQSALKKQQQQQKSLWKRNLFCRALCSMASLGTYESAAGFMGMLASYDRSRNYFIQTEDLSKWKAHICGSIVSGFFSAASSQSVHYVGFIANAVQTGKLAYLNIPRTVCAVVTPNSGYHFYTNFLYRFHHATAFCVIQYGIYEGLRGVDWTK